MKPKYVYRVVEWVFGFGALISLLLIWDVKILGMNFMRVFLGWMAFTFLNTISECARKDADKEP